ncbi:DNA phosphorothioation-associated putative methyltransferase [Paraburkholderia caballeronis]|uniref:DNA phosphorothioation-associated putative methyltransferase n=1 Tax=Paraburkholderia caballeronis TaxID=416943 RepID=UPI001065F805|nr:DNA phosphorothioation-associated putative methyltransferase [Paraburkholderia caballeronis]TDV37464.1 DNA phosphorothioation-associated putative methyltransferase [Paraburkholderia caballeronis]
MVGKRVHDTLYIHLSAVDQLQEDTQKAIINQAVDTIGPADGLVPNVAKINLRTGSFSLLAYPDFDEEAFPTLRASWSFSVEAPAKPIFRSYLDSLNPPILHRKERLVLENYPQRDKWMEITSAAERLGLFDDTSTIGFKLNWERLIAAKGYALVETEFHPLGNDIPAESPQVSVHSQAIQRHLTALNRSTLSAPVQLLIRHGLLPLGSEFFDYGCGRGGDLEGLRGLGFEVSGWDPHYAPQAERRKADVVNLGFVVNVIEDAAERIEALQGAFHLAKRVLSIGVMLYGSEVGGRPYRDGFVTSRNTFQKYFAQTELKDFIESVLHREAFLVAPGIAFVFADGDAEQSFVAGRYRRRNLAERLLSAEAAMARIHRREIKRASKESRVAIASQNKAAKAEHERAVIQPHLDRLWALSLDLGREPDPSEVPDLDALLQAVNHYPRAVRLVRESFDQALLQSSARVRADDLRLYFAVAHFEKRQSYRTLEPRLQRDVKSFFGDYASAQNAGVQLLREAADPALILTACQEAQTNGIGWLDGEHSLQLHISMVERLPVVLRAYIACAMVIWDSTSDVQLVKIHITSGKLTLLEFGDFDTSPLPTLRRRLKINIRKQMCDEYKYGSREYPNPHLYGKSRFLNEDYPGYAEQLAFDDAFEAAGLLDLNAGSPSTQQVATELGLRRLEVSGMHLIRSSVIPDLDQPCGGNFTFRDFIECGETQKRTGIPNLPRSAATYNSLYDLASLVLDPIIEYFGAIRLTYGFCSAELSRHIARRVAPRLDQHAACEVNTRGTLICERGGAACDFIIDDENMDEVVEWIIANVGFDRLYYYGKDRPIHISWAPSCTGEVYSMTLSASGRLIPRRYGKR